MRQIFKKVILLLAACMVFLSGPVSVSAAGLNVYAQNPDTGYEARVIDEAGLFTEDEARRLYEELYAMTGETNAVVFTAAQNPFGYSDTSNTYEFYLAESLCDELYPEVRYNGKSCVIFLIDMDTRWLYIYRDGAVKSNLTEGKSDSITDNAYRYAKNGDYFKCAEAAVKQMSSVVAGRMIFEPMKIVSNLFIGLAISFVITYIYASCVSKSRKPATKELLEYADRYMRIRDTNDITTSIDKVYSPPSSGSSSGRSGGGFHGGGGGGHHGGGGGGHHGGGGGHRF